MTRSKSNFTIPVYSILYEAANNRAIRIWIVLNYRQTFSTNESILHEITMTIDYDRKMITRMSVKVSRVFINRGFLQGSDRREM